MFVWACGGSDWTETVVLSGTSKITELDIHRFYWRNRPPSGFPRVLRALARRPTLIKLGLRRYPLCLDNARLLRMALCDIPSLQSLDLTDSTLGSAELAELAPALYHNRSIEVLDISRNELDGIDSAEILRDILRSNRTITKLDSSGGIISGKRPALLIALRRGWRWVATQRY
jgi:hypothetical protein